MSNNRLRGIRAPLDSGYLLGRLVKGRGDVHPIKLVDLNTALQNQPNGASGGGLDPIADKEILSNISGSSGVPVGNTLSALLDAILGNTSGLIVNRGSSAWRANDLSSLLDTAFTSTQGSVLYRGASGWTFLAPGTTGQALLTQGASANPKWGTIGAGSGGFNGWFSQPAWGHATSGVGPAYNFTPIFMPNGYTVKSVSFMPLATSSTFQFGAALYGVKSATDPTPGALLASASSLTTGTTAGTMATSTYSSAYTATGDQMVWAGLYISANLSIAQSTGESAFHTTGSVWPPANPWTLGVTTATTYSAAAFGTAP